jgi:hypothetical protein
MPIIEKGTTGMTPSTYILEVLDIDEQPELWEKTRLNSIPEA